jgi:hypothetical protein
VAVLFLRLTRLPDFGVVLQLISKYILLFPALDVASAFPLNAITLVRPPHEPSHC